MIPFPPPGDTGLEPTRLDARQQGHARAEPWTGLAVGLIGQARYFAVSRQPNLLRVKPQV